MSPRAPAEAGRAAAGRSPGACSKPAEQGRLFLRQTVLLTRRYFAIWRGDYLALLAMLGQSFVVAVLLGILFGDLESNRLDHGRIRRNGPPGSRLRGRHRTTPASR